MGAFGKIILKWFSEIKWGVYNFLKTYRMLFFSCSEHVSCVAYYRIFSRNLRTFFSILAAEKSGCVKYADFFYGGLDLGFILVF